MNKKLFLDTNFWIRYVLQEYTVQFSHVLNLVKQIEDGGYLPYISAVVLLEIFFVLSRIYRKSEFDIDRFVNKILITRNLTVIDKTNFVKAFKWHQKLGIRIADCLIASSVPPDCRLVTWDKDFTKIKDIKTTTPDKLI